ncbi:cell death regulator Aven [Bombina bombina]|uniref:cell death regulator Aven n=1 Tax=Bombina bombina TaxID=8345 RepID=UPI00235AAEA6|nr:cell death regulator Aven [Bombina bombina]
MERGRGKHRRGGGGARRRPGGDRWDRGGGTDRESANVARGRRRELETPQKDVEGTETQEEKVSVGFSKRKILSNWDRYAETEKEPEDKVLQRGADYSVLLGSAGDSFTQFRFADERDWDVDKTSNKPAVISFDSQYLLRALQELPLHLRLNVEADLVQEELPQELPQYKPMDIKSLPPTLNKLPATGPSESLVPAKVSQDAPLPTLDEELDFLLSLDAPVREEAISTKTPSGNEENKVEVMSEDEVPPPVPDNICMSAEETQKTVTPDDLEDWLDSMIS